MASLDPAMLTNTNVGDQERAGRGIRGTGLEELTDTGKREGRVFTADAL